MEPIYIAYGTDLRVQTCGLLERADVASRLRGGMRVVVKPNLVVARPAEEGATTHPEIVAGIVEFLQDHGVRDIEIAEGAWVGERDTDTAFRRCGFADLARKYGIKMRDTKRDRAVRLEACGMALSVCESVLNADFLINVPVLKGHCQTGMTCCLKNLKGCIPDSEKRRFHTLGLHKPIAALNAALRPALHVVDGICGDLSFEEGGNPVRADRILLGWDPVQLDSYGSRLLGFAPEDIEYIGLAQASGVGEMAPESCPVVELNADRRPRATPARAGTIRALARHIEAQDACSACYAALILALDKADAHSLTERVKIGQGFRGQTLPGLGVGRCLSGCARNVPGCPPTAEAIRVFLEGLSAL